MRSIRPFHVAFPVRDLEEARTFYAQTLGCSTGRESNLWIDFNLFGHQIVAHLSLEETKEVQKNPVDGNAVPVRHFGVILESSEWEELKDRIRKSGIQFLIEPRIRFDGKPGEQRTMFLMDPSGNALEFKSFANDNYIFQK
ncbi:MAG: VOC family protein [Candidatus Marinimicrobia bacterium]|jgi:hypothetical protein|nr:VOC family protein [Candidatus Neomarinimicrobiota bacterium]MBT3618138.1 VOC family protein [Candidatus Neomarinimicrobiota bacterium]MBT3828609.1 VOC family protein [Candidatus Neomarinimicrobiota bacterium]MBT3996929.1 VOC family protein [Candidatus Neomarinimicrobiota bacterium]MBT4280893.1 VOC family protein [Candidatus Neomarinimicrobiota bacterium]